MLFRRTAGGRTKLPLETIHDNKRLLRTWHTTLCIPLVLQLALCKSCNQPHFINICNQLHSWRSSWPPSLLCKDKSAITLNFSLLGLIVASDVIQSYLDLIAFTMGFFFYSYLGIQKSDLQLVHQYNNLTILKHLQNNQQDNEEPCWQEFLKYILAHNSRWATWAGFTSKTWTCNLQHFSNYLLGPKHFHYSAAPARTAVLFLGSTPTHSEPPPPAPPYTPQFVIQSYLSPELTDIL